MKKEVKKTTEKAIVSEDRNEKILSKDYKLKNESLTEILSVSEIDNVVNSWYLNGMPIVFQTKNGIEIDEIIENDAYDMYERNLIKEFDLSLKDVIELIAYWYEVIYDGDKLYAGDQQIELNDYCTYKLVQMIFEV
jgi:uncharacterized protein (DUF433 family)